MKFRKLRIFTGCEFLQLAKFHYKIFGFLASGAETKQQPAKINTVKIKKYINMKNKPENKN